MLRDVNQTLRSAHVKIQTLLFSQTSPEYPCPIDPETNYFALIVDVVDLKVSIPIVKLLKDKLKGKREDAASFLQRSPWLYQKTTDWKALFMYITGRNFIAYPPSCYLDNRYKGGRRSNTIVAAVECIQFSSVS